MPVHDDHALARACRRRGGLANRSDVEANLLDQQSYTSPGRCQEYLHFILS